MKLAQKIKNRNQISDRIIRPKLCYKRSNGVKIILYNFYLELI